MSMKKNKVRRMNQKSADPSNWACVDTFNRRIFDTGRYLIIGGLIAAAMQTYLPTRIMLTLGSTKIFSHYHHAVIGLYDVSLLRSRCVYRIFFVKSVRHSTCSCLFGLWPNGRYQKSTDDETIFYRTLYFIADRTDCP